MRATRPTCSTSRPPRPGCGRSAAVGRDGASHEYDSAPKTLPFERCDSAPKTVHVEPCQQAERIRSRSPDQRHCRSPRRSATSTPADRRTASGLASTSPEADGGVLRPTLVIGVGGFGLLALRELRSRLTDRVGDLRQVPAVRFLYLDADPEARDDRVVGLARTGPCYRNRCFRRRCSRSAGIAVPRSGSSERMAAAREAARHPAEHAPAGVAGARPVGVHRELPAIRHPRPPGAGDRRPPGVLDAVGRPLRTARRATRGRACSCWPRPAAASSGALPDIGYAVTKLLTQLKLPTQVTAFLFLGAPGRPDHAAGRVRERLRHPDRAESLRRRLDHVPLALRRTGRPAGRVAGAAVLDRLPGPARRPRAGRRGRVRRAPGRVPVPRPDHRPRRRSWTSRGPQSRGLFRCVRHRRRLVPAWASACASAARHVCERLIQQWQAPGPTATPVVEEVCRKALADPGLKPERISMQITDDGQVC